MSDSPQPAAAADKGIGTEAADHRVGAAAAGDRAAVRGVELGVECVAAIGAWG